MATNRVKEYYKGFELVAAFYKGEYRARSHHRFATTRQVDECADTDDAIAQIKEAVEDELERHGEEIRNLVKENHKRSLQKAGKPYHGVRAVTAFRRINHCYRCKRPVDNSYDLECVACAWIICGNCGACGCEYAGG